MPSDFQRNLSDLERQSGGYREIRTVARILGPALLLIGAALIIVALVSFFTAMSQHRPPEYFWCFFAGVPIIGIGGALTQFGYIGWFLRYLATEAAPVQKDTFNYVAQGIRPGVKDLVQAVREGLTDESPEASTTERKFCSQCGHATHKSANFCSGCGQKFD